MTCTLFDAILDHSLGVHNHPPVKIYIEFKKYIHFTIKQQKKEQKLSSLKNHITMIRLLTARYVVNPSANISAFVRAE